MIDPVHMQTQPRPAATPSLQRRSVPGRWFLTLAGLLLLHAFVATAVQAQKRSGGFETKAGQAILMEADSGAILYQHNADDLVPPDSMTKLMTLAVVFRLIKEGKLKPTDEFLMSEHGWRTGGWGSGMQAMMVPLRRKVSLSELILGIAVFNGNDAAICIAEGIAGSEAKFATLMTAEARSIGLQTSQFRNPTGYPVAGHQMSVKEVALLARHIISTYPEQFKSFAVRDFNYRQKLINRNPMLFSDPTVDGMITSDLARNPKGPKYGLVATVLRGGRRLIAVVHGADSAAERKSEVTRIIEWGYKNVAAFKLFDGHEVVGMARVWGGSAFYVPLVGQEDVSVWLPRFPASQRLRGEIVYASPLKAPIKKGDQIARLRVTSSASAVQEVPLYAAEDVGSGGMAWRGLDSLAHMAFRLLPELPVVKDR